MGRGVSAEIDLDAPLSAEASAWVDDAGVELEAKQQALEQDWQLSTSSRWTYDPTTGTLAFEFSGERTVVADGQLLGTFSVSGRSFEWAWNSPHFSPAITRDSEVVRALGEKYEMAYLLEGMIPLSGDPFLSYLCAIAVKATASSGVFRGTAGDIHPLILLKNIRRV